MVQKGTLAKFLHHTVKIINKNCTVLGLGLVSSC